MTRQSLSDPRKENRASAFFPTFQKEMNRLLDQFRSGDFLPDERVSSLFSQPAFPAIDVVDHGDTVEVTAEIPGVDRDDIDASIVGDRLTIKGEKSAGHETKEDDFHMIERQYGSFRRSIPLGFTPASDAVDAEFADGVLTLRIAKPAEAKSDVQKISIKKK